MQIDQTTLNDLSIFNNEDEQHSLFNHFNFAQTIDGKNYLKSILSNPLKSVEDISDIQILMLELQKCKDQFPSKITNGTIMVMEKFFETPVDDFPLKPNEFNARVYKIISASDYALTKYSIEHFVYFVKGMHEIVELFNQSNSKLLKGWVEQIESLLDYHPLKEMNKIYEPKNVNIMGNIHFANYIKKNFKQNCFKLIEIYSKLDAYLGLAIACSKYNYQLPVFIKSDEPHLKVNGMYHPLLQKPVAYDIELKVDNNFLFLTGANMAGKSTFIKALGVNVYLAHLGLGVAAKEVELSFFDGLLSNIQVNDNLVKGESYFFNEIQRIKRTIQQISNGKNWLILIDELFKGTNIQDAMKCSLTVINGLNKMPNALFVLSTHLYEIGEEINHLKNIQFKYFETKVNGTKLEFGYQMKTGISSDRLGYLILENEGVVDLLNKI